LKKFLLTAPARNFRFSASMTPGAEIYPVKATINRTGLGFGETLERIGQNPFV
jgi:hypothetical protein